MATQQQASPTASPIGRDTIRVDGPRKVTGLAQYTSDFHFPGMLYAVPVGATIANGKITKLDTARAEKMPGVRAILHRGNIGRIFRSIPPGICGHLRRAAPAFRR
jgi:xanthine dehydrogenase YagR molybdenum-binding subunit